MFLLLALFWIAQHVFVIWTGCYIAQAYGKSRLIGGLVGLFFWVPGVLVLWAALYLMTPTPPTPKAGT